MVPPGFLPLYFCTELVSEYLSYLPFSNVETCSQVCRNWVQPAKTHTLRVLNVCNPVKIGDLLHNPDFVRFVCAVVIPFNFPITAQPWFPSIRNLTSIEILHSTYSFAACSSDLPYVIQSFSACLESLIIHEDLSSLSPGHFRDLLSALSLCPNLHHLQLPKPGHSSAFWPPDEQDMQAFFLLFSSRLERRPNPITLKLVSSHEQYFPKQERVQEAVAHQIQWLWLRDMICPFDFARTQNLVVQSVDPAQQLLP
ncbi:hypothetical protein GYMLUDRAFT_252798 [Collybiopsis luxurians FD-317 M1]|uniref:F-box domain-containing protein n=1 Tax=Collybiopsis luxurians FD-317 M1 TaxID=944289 RepID=A0A0D0AKC7_9AGAR|nr:hypothetical protein GYMLUDRAFT_252798 [Collybiopsis luxurians FD-317 M1]